MYNLNDGNTTRNPNFCPCHFCTEIKVLYVHEFCQFNWIQLKWKKLEMLFYLKKPAGGHWFLWGSILWAPGLQPYSRSRNVLFSRIRILQPVQWASSHTSTRTGKRFQIWRCKWHWEILTDLQHLKNWSEIITKLEYPM